MGELKIKVKYSREITDPGTPAIEENFKTGQLQWSIPVSDAALLLVDCWGNYPLKSFSERASEICKNTIRPTADACRKDRRLKAGINLDGPQLGLLFQEPFPVPFMTMSAKQDHYPLDLAYEESVQPAYRVSFAECKHINFSDASIMAPIFGRQMGLVGTIDGHSMLSRINGYAVAFFDRHLKYENTPFPVVPESSVGMITLDSRNT